MAKYQTKSVTIEAEQWFPGKQVEGVINHDSRYQAYVDTIRGGKVYISEGDYIIKEYDGKHYYPCKSNIFEQKYEKIGE